MRELKIIKKKKKFGLEWLNLLLFLSLEKTNFELVYYYIVVIVTIFFKINVDAAVAANGHCYQTLVKMVNRLHSNLCSLADCIKQLQTVYTQHKRLEDFCLGPAAYSHF